MAAAAGLDFSQQNLSQKFGNEVVNYFSGSPLNRVSFLRADTAFLAAALAVAKILPFSDLDPLTASPKELSYTSMSVPAIAELIGTPYTAPEADLIAAHDSRHSPPTLLFLGLLESDKSSAFSYADGKYSGQPFFALDVTAHPTVAAALTAGKPELEFRKTRLNLQLPPNDAAVVAMARHVLHWNDRNTFCSACGSRTMSVHGGTKRVCPATDAAAPDTPRAACVSRQGVHNIAFPRTDPTVIMAVVNAAGDKVLLGRQRRWPDRFYSCLAGFCEPAESVEEAVRRETWEETGVHVGRVVIHSSQPWPYPACLMLGAVGEALPGGEGIDLGNDPELHEAQWYDVEFLRRMLAKPQRGLDEAEGEGDMEEGDIRLPPPTAIAHQLLLAVTKGYHLAAKM
ncbi:NUDIX hydrolase domain-like protein [Geopyxis carbonaria]|nr:NUDIX hydrolase domain-like protein [Geopyxis carbonaria]